MTGNDEPILNHVRRGLPLLMDADLVGDRDDHASWKQRRDAWAAEAEAALASLADTSTLDAFKRTNINRASTGDVPADLAVELTVLRRGLTVLLAACETRSM